MPIFVVRTLAITSFLLFLGIGPRGTFVSSARAADGTFVDIFRGSNSQDSEDPQDDNAASIRSASQGSKPSAETTTDLGGTQDSVPDLRLVPDGLFEGGLKPISPVYTPPRDAILKSSSSPSTFSAPVLRSPTPDDRSISSEPVTSLGRPAISSDVFSHFHRNQSDFNSSDDDFAWRLGGLGRCYYLDDPRYEFTGCEQSFGVQGVIEGGVRHLEGDWILSLESQFFLNQPYDKNILGGTPFLDSFQANFQVDPFQISIMTFNARNHNFLVQVGRFVTPFGRFYYPNYNNNFWDSPFIRSDAILYRETGALLQWDPEPFIATVAITNGGLEQDTNSSKAFIARVGLYGDSFAVGASVKSQDGIGSEWQKECNSHIGVDAMYRWGGRWTLSGEAIIDYYGMNRPGFDPNDITWGRSIYFRDANQNVGGPLVGYGYYVNLERGGERWLWNFNYGDYLPQKIGIPQQDTPIHRGLIKGTRHVTSYLDVFAVTMIENSVEIMPGHMRGGVGFFAGFQFML